MRLLRNETETNSLPPIVDKWCYCILTSFLLRVNYLYNTLQLWCFALLQHISVAPTLHMSISDWTNRDWHCPFSLKMIPNQLPNWVALCSCENLLTDNWLPILENFTQSKDPPHCKPDGPKSLASEHQFAWGNKSIKGSSKHTILLDADICLTIYKST